MITRDNLKEVINGLSAKDIKRIRSGRYEYTVLILCVFNAGSVTWAKCTNNYRRYQNVGNNGDAIFETSDIINFLDQQIDKRFN